MKNIKSQKQDKTNDKKRMLDVISKYLTIVYLVIISVVFFINYNLTFDEKINLNGDNISYYSLGKALSEGKGFTNTIALNESPHSHFPPGYPFFIATLMKCGISSIHAMKVANGVLLFASLILFYFILAHFARSRHVAFAAVLFAALHTQLLGFACIMMSEMLFIFFACLTLLMILYFPPDKLFVDPKKRWKDILILCALAICLSCIYLIRTMGLAIILSAIAYFGVFMLQKLFLLFKNRKNQELARQNKLAFLKYGLVFLITVVSFLAPKTAWDMRNKKIGGKIDSYDSIFLAKKNGAKIETWSEWKDRLKNNTSNYITKYIPTSVFQYKIDVDYYPTETGKFPSSKEWILGGLFLLFLIFSVIKCRDGLILAFYIGATFLVLLVWQEQYGGLRYMIPIIPFLVFLFFNGVEKLVALLLRPVKKVKPFIPQIVVLFLCCYFMYPAYIKAQNELRKTAKIRSWEKFNDPKMNNYLAACKFCKESLPDSIRVVTRKPEIFYMFSGYKKSTNFPWNIEPDSVISFLKNRQTTHVILDDWFRHAYVTLFPAVQKYPEKFKILTMIGKADTVSKQNPTYVLEFNDEWGYHGAYKDGKKDGEGYELFQDGRKYAGNFENGLPNGYGALYDPNGEIIVQGRWRDGAYVGAK